MNLHHWIRQGHRWLGIVLTLTILANFAAMAFGEPPALLVYSPLAPLALQLISGLYLFLRPHGPRRQAAPIEAGAA